MPKLLIIRYYAVLVMCLIGVFLLVPVNCEAEETANSHCNNLHQVKDIDDLLLQFYSNIDNQCLFEMPTQQLEKIWRVRILDYVNADSKKISDLNTEFHRIIENEQSLFICKKDFEQGVIALDINLTNEYIKQNTGWGGLISKGQYPKLLPLPQVVSVFFDEPYEILPVIHSTRPHIPKDTIYREYSYYYWLNKAQLDNQPVLFFETGFFPKPMSMTFYSQARILDYK